MQRPLAVTFACFLASCTSGQSSHQSQPTPPAKPVPTDTPESAPVDSGQHPHAELNAAPETTVENNAAWHPTLQTIAQLYTSWGRVDDEMRFAPTLCRIPRPGQYELSSSKDGNTHGQKIYSLYAFDPVAYGAPPTMMMPMMDGKDTPKLVGVSQAIVKEAFAPKQVDGPTAGLHEPAPATRDGKFFGKGDPAGLYVMFKPNDVDFETDAGWVYATITPDGNITAAGKIRSCIGCHQKNPDRVFGMPREVGIAPQARGPNGGKVVAPSNL